MHHGSERTLLALQLFILLMPDAPRYSLPTLGIHFRYPQSLEGSVPRYLNQLDDRVLTPQVANPG